MTNSTLYPIFGFLPGTLPFVPAQSSTTNNSTINLNIGNLFCCGTGVFYIANSASGASAASSTTYVKYLYGNFSGGGGSLTTSTNRYGTNFTPVTFNRVNISFNFPASNNTPTTSTYSTNQYISSYGCSCRIIGSDPANGIANGNIFPSAQTFQAYNSFSQVGRAYLSF